LAETGNPVGKTENFYRFLFEVPAGAITMFAVIERTLAVTYLYRHTKLPFSDFIGKNTIERENRSASYHPRPLGFLAQIQICVR